MAICIIIPFLSFNVSVNLIMLIYSLKIIDVLFKYESS